MSCSFNTPAKAGVSLARRPRPVVRTFAHRRFVHLSSKGKCTDSNFLGLANATLQQCRVVSCQCSPAIEKRTKQKGHLLLARLLEFFPAWLTGRIEPRARRVVRSWTKNNATLRTFQYGIFRRLLMWSTDHPMVFALAAGVAAACIAYLVAVQEWTTPWRLAAPKLKNDFDIGAYTGVPWSIQATLVALVYPIVLSFIALMLQRKAHSTVALRVYVLDSAIVPAGASSVGLLVAMGVQYFAAPYSTSALLAEYMAPLLIMNGTWLLINVLLTGFFLSRTIHFIQEDEQRHAFTRVAVDVVLRSELISAVKQHIFVNAAQSDWYFTEIGASDDATPQVHMFALGIGDSRPVVKRDLKGNLVLHDVHLHLLKLVATSWSRRAVNSPSSAQGKTPTLIFPPRVGGAMSGEVVLCAVQDGPPLNRMERCLVRTAFVYRPSRQGKLSLSTRKMLEEIGSEVESAAEQQRFGAAEENLRNLLRLHTTLLLASAADSEGVAGNAATIGTSPYSWGDSSFDMEWLKPYRDIGQIAVNRLEEDTRLFRVLAVVPASIAAKLPSRPEKLLIDAQLPGMNLAYQLAGWWVQKTDASLLSGATTISGTLPAPLSKVYEQAVVAFIGSWGHFRVNLPNDFDDDDAQAWHAIAGRALIYAKHIENSANLFLKAVSRGDETGATWLLDNLLKWWGNRKRELKYAHIERDFKIRHVTMTLADKDWAAAQSFLWNGSEPVTIQFAESALSIAILRYWESMRLYVVLLLVQSARATPTADSRELRYAASLIRGNAQRPGGSVDARSLSSIDVMLESILENIFGLETVVGRIDEFVERLPRSTETPRVSGWIYSWPGTATDLESMKHAQAVLLVSLTACRRNSVTRSKKLIERWWTDIDKLESVQQYCADLRREVLSNSFSEAHSVVSSLQGFLESTHRVRSARLAAAVALKTLSGVARKERQLTLRAQSIDQSKVRDLSQRISARALDSTKLPPPLGALKFLPGLTAHSNSIDFIDNKKHYLEHIGTGSDSDLAEFIGEWAREKIVAWSYEKLVESAALMPVNSPTLRQNYDPSRVEMQAFLTDVASHCSAYRTRGEKPVVLVGNSAVGTLLRESMWGHEDWKCPLPEGVVIGAGDAANGTGIISLVNDVPVFEFETPHGDCYVLPDAMLKTLCIGSSDANTAMTISWSEESDDKLRFTLSWKAGFLPVTD